MRTKHNRVRAGRPDAFVWPYRQPYERTAAPTPPAPGVYSAFFEVVFAQRRPPGIGRTGGSFHCRTHRSRRPRLTFIADRSDHSPDPKADFARYPPNADAPRAQPADPALRPPTKVHTGERSGQRREACVDWHKQPPPLSCKMYQVCSGGGSVGGAIGGFTYVNFVRPDWKIVLKVCTAVSL